MWIPSVHYIIALYDDQIKEGVLINHAGLISTLDKVEWGIAFQGEPTFWDQATILYKELVENHYFSDGNKRIGLLVVYIFLIKNGYRFNPLKGEIFDMTIKVAQGSASFDEIKQWFEKNSEQIG